MLHHRHEYILLPFVLDLVGITIAHILAEKIRTDFNLGRDILAPIDAPLLPLILITLMVWIGLVFLLDVYQKDFHLQQIFTTASLTLLILAGILYFTFRNVPRLQVVYFYLLQITFLITWRLVARRLTHQNSLPRRILIVGANELGHQVAATIEEYPGLHWVGFVDETPHDDLLGSFETLAGIVTENQVDEVIIALPNQTYQQINDVVVRLQALPIQIRIVPSYLSLALHRATVEDFGGLLLISLRTPALTPYQRLVKRIFDLVIVITALPIVLPIMGLIALAIKLNSKGNVIYRQERVGENGRIFIMFKFRTMLDHERPIFSDDELQAIRHKNPDDPYVTSVGRFLRHTSLDELPQLFNVLKGEMSLVGPRPEMPWLVEKYDTWQRKRFAVPQGMTGWWQVNGRSKKLMHLHTEDDLYYIQNYSILLDIQILLRTIPAVLRRDGAF